MRGRAAYAVVVAASCALAVTALLLNVFGAPPMLARVRALGQYILANTFNIFHKAFWAGSPEAVTATLWDYRGLDTVFETTVLYAAIIGCAVLGYVGLKGLRVEDVLRGEGLTLIVKAASKILFALILITSVNLALHGYITPGGGFAGGSTFAIAPLIIVAAFSTQALIRRGFKLVKSAMIRSAGLAFLAFIVLAPLAYYGFILQNQFKHAARFPGYPAFLGPLFLGGSLLYLNIGEFLIVGMEFVMVFILFTLIDLAFKGVGRSGK